MNAYDFEYDGLRLSDMGFVICKFDHSGGLETVTNGSQITFNTVSTLNGSKHELLSTQYDNCLETSFQICKDICNGNNELDINADELRKIMKWLNRKEFHKFKILDDEAYKKIYFEASFNINRLEMEGKLYGLELNMITNRPFALHEAETLTIKNTKANGRATINSLSDEEGYIYPNMEIVVNQSGDLNIYNSLEDRTMVIKNCTIGEKITLDYPIIQSSLNSHKIQNDFNWTFFRIANSYSNSKNDLTISIPCTITITYTPTIKLGI